MVYDDDEHVGTIGDDDEVEASDGSLEVEGAVAASNGFLDGFGGGGGGTKHHAWDLTVAIRAAAPLEGFRSSVEAKIRTRQERKRKHVAEDAEKAAGEDGQDGEDDAGESGEDGDEDGDENADNTAAEGTDNADQNGEDGDEDGDKNDDENAAEGTDVDEDADEEDDEEDEEDGDEDDDDDTGEQEAGEPVAEDVVAVKKGASREKSVDGKPFDKLHLSKPLLKAIGKLDWDLATPVQVKTIPLILSGRDVCGSAVTGSGKTAAFVLPILERLLQAGAKGRSSATRVLILLPTRELAVQCHAVVVSLSQHTGIQAGLAVGGLSNKAQEVALRARPEILVATPGRLIDHVRNAQGFTLDDIEILVMDEADRLLEMGFRDEIEEIVQFCPGSRQSLLFSATMTTQVQWLVKLSLRNPLKVSVDQKFDVAETLSQEFIRLRDRTESSRDAVLLALVTRSFATKTIIFFTKKHVAHRFRIIFGFAGLSAAELHGNLTQAQRLIALQDFRDSKVDFLLCTDLAARGLDIVGVNTVINYEMPRTMTDYVHRVGRTARAGKEGKAVSIVGEHERKLLREIHRKAKDQLSSRKVPTKVVASWREKIDAMNDDVEAVMKEERREKEMRMADLEVQKAENLLKHDKEIYSRPKRTWFQSSEKKAELQAQTRKSRGIRGKDDDEEAKKRTRADRKQERREKSKKQAWDEQKKTAERERKVSQLIVKRARKMERKKSHDRDTRAAAKSEGPQKKRRKSK